MFQYEKRLQYPIHIKQTNPQAAAIIISQYGGPDGELGASLRYLSQRYTMPYREVAGLLTDIAVEELGHLEMVSTIVYQLTDGLSPEEIKASGYDKYFVDHTLGVYPQAASGTPFSADTFQSTGDTIADLYEDMAAEQKARTTYDNILRMVKDPDIVDPIRFLRAREIVHFQRSSGLQKLLYVQSVFRLLIGLGILWRLHIAASLGRTALSHLWHIAILAHITLWSATHIAVHILSVHRSAAHGINASSGRDHHRIYRKGLVFCAVHSHSVSLSTGPCHILKMMYCKCHIWIKDPRTILAWHLRSLLPSDNSPVSAKVSCSRHFAESDYRCGCGLPHQR